MKVMFEGKSLNMTDGPCSESWKTYSGPLWAIIKFNLNYLELVAITSESASRLINYHVLVAVDR